MHLPGTILTITVGNHPKIIPVKFGQNQFCSFRGADVLSELVKQTQNRSRTKSSHFVLRWAKRPQPTVDHGAKMHLKVEHRNGMHSSTFIGEYVNEHTHVSIKSAIYTAAVI